MSVVTKVGDRGTTKLFSGETIGKETLRLETYGTVDELVSSLGFAKSLCENASVAEHVHSIQQELFMLGAELATTDPENAPFEITVLTQEHVEALESIVTAIESQITLPKAFIIPGGCTSSAALDVARTVCRRLERRLVEMHSTEQFTNRSALIYINRLSDVCFLLGRVEEAQQGVEYDSVS